MAGRTVLKSQNIQLGCAASTLLLLFGLAALVVITVNREHYADQYPLSLAVSSHSDYRVLKTRLSWANSYRTTDDFVSVYNWYSTTFELGAEVRANSNCIVLEGSSTRLIVTRSTSVILCDIGDSRMVYVSRSTALD